MWLIARLNRHVPDGFRGQHSADSKLARLLPRVVAERAGIDKIETLGRDIEEKTSAYPEHSRAMEHASKTKQPVSTDMEPTKDNSKTHLIGEEEHPLALNRALNAFVSVQ